MVFDCKIRRELNENDLSKETKLKPKLTRSLMSDYADSSTIHGVRYLTEPKRPLAERIWWIIAFVISITCCCLLIFKVWNKWAENPVLISFADRPTPVSEIPFPAITICPQSKFNSEEFKFPHYFNLMTKKKYNDYSQNISKDHVQKMKSIMQICNDDYTSQLKLLNQTYTDKTCIQDLIELAPKLSDLISACDFQDTTELCEHFFTQIVTDLGICYTFNILNTKDLYREKEIQKSYEYYKHSRRTIQWTLENGYTDKAPEIGYPRRVLSSNKKDSLSVYLRLYPKYFDYMCSGPVLGFKILFHNPNVIPRFHKNFHHIHLEEDVVFTITPKLTKTSAGLRNYSPHIRQCYYTKDKYLKFFNVYTQENCELECLANYTLSSCGCVLFYMPSAPGTRICGSDLRKCSKNAAYKLDTSQQKQMLRKSDGEKIGCNCLPACTSISYETEIEKHFPNWDKLLHSLDIDEIPEYKMSRISVRFRETEFISNQRSELYGATDFVANCGGLLGLFMGVSLLSIVEIIYFCTFRFFSNLRLKANRRNSSSEIENLAVSDNGNE